MTFRNASAAAIAAFSLTGAAAAQQYNIDLLDAVPGTDDYFLTDINNKGQIVGYARDLNGDSRAVLWDASGAHVLDDLGTAFGRSEAYGINESGQIVGWSRDNDNNSHAVLWNSEGGLDDLGFLSGGTFSFAHDINDNGVVVGSSGSATGQHAFVWTQDGGMVDYGSFDSKNAQFIAGFNGINNNGKMAGTGYRLFSPWHAAMGQVGDPQVIDISPAGQFSTGMGLDVNDAGTLIGYQNDGSGSPEAAIFHGDGTYTSLGSLGIGESWASAINDSGVIVGRIFGDVEGTWVNKAFAYQDGQMHDLLELLPADSGWEVLYSADGINDQGQIVGVGLYEGEIRGFVISPIPEPATAGVMALAGMALLRRRR